MDVLSDEKWARWDSCDDNFAKYAHVKSNLIYGHLPAEKPDVSIMIPTFRRADLLREAINSALNQKTKYSYTITVVDNDGEGYEKTDALMKEYCEKYPNISYYRNEKNIGVFGNWNRCIELAQADWLCMLHDDDMMKENTVEKLYSVAQTGKYGIVCCACTVLDDRKNEQKRLSSTGFGPIVSVLENMFIKARKGKEIPMKKSDIYRGIVIGSAVHMVQKKAAVLNGGYNIDFDPISDVIFYQLTLKTVGGGYLPEQLYYYRIQDNISLDLSTAYVGMDLCSEWQSYTCKQAGRSEFFCRRKYYEYIIYYHYMRLDNKDKMSTDDIRKRFDIPKIYCVSVIRFLIIFKYVFRWGLLLFRRR